MARPRTYKTEAVVLKQFALGEADRILTLFSPEMGKIRAVAKSVRRTKSRLRGQLELLNQATVSLSLGRNLDVVNEAQIVNSFQTFKTDLERVSRGMYIAELVDHFSTEREPNFNLYQLLILGLGWMGEATDPDLVVRYFEIQLLRLTGYTPEIVDCVECRETLLPGDHFFSPAEGGVLCESCRVGSDDVMVPVTLNTMKVLRFLTRERRYDNIDALGVSPAIVSSIERLTRNYIRFILERDLKSAQFMNLVSSGGAR